MAIQSTRIDSWMKELEEASQLIVKLEFKLDNFNTKDSPKTEPLVGARSSIEGAQSMLFELGVKLDRLDSLLRNPPAKPILVDEDVAFRWSMLSSIKQRTRAAAHSLSAIAASYRAVNSDFGETSQSVKQDKSNSCEDDAEILIPFVSDWAKESELKMKPSSSSTPWTCLLKLCWAVVIGVGVAALLFLLVVIVAAVQSIYPD